MLKFIVRVSLMTIAIATAASSFALAQQKQTKITGTVMDSLENRPIEFATVSLLNSEGVPVLAVAADGKGRFEFIVKEQGEYLFVASAVGYLPYHTELNLNESVAEMGLGELFLTQGIEMEQVNVVAQRPLITIEPDKLVYSVEADPDAQFSTLAEIIRKIPQLSIDGQDNVLLNGQSNYKVLVNGKTSTMMSNNFKEVIQAMPANSIRDIEVITNPSMKYEAEGVGGIINIITVRQRISGYSGRVGVGVGDQGMIQPNGYVSAQMGKFSVSANYWFYRRDDKGGSAVIDNINKNLTDKFRSRSETDREYRWYGHGVNLEASYEIDTMNLITVSLYGNKFVTNLNSWGQNLFYDSRNVINEQIDAHIRLRQKSQSLNASIDYQRSFTKPERTFTLSYQAEVRPGSHRTRTRTDSLTIYKRDDRLQRNKTNGTEHTFQADYFDPFGDKHNLEAGFKYILRLNTSDTEKFRNTNIGDNFWDGADEQWVDDMESGFNDLDYTQHVFGAYGGYMFKLPKFMVKAGFRVEGTWNSGKSTGITHTQDFENTQFNFIPYANLTFMPDPLQSISLSYTQRLMRPGIYYLNPYENDNDLFFVQRGNPDLDAVVSHSVSLTYRLIKPSWNIMLGADGQFSGNNINQVTELLTDHPRYKPGTLLSTYENLGDDRTVILWGYFSYRLNTLLSLYAGVNGYYQYMNAPSLDLKNDGFSFNAYGGFNVTLWKDARFSANAGYWGKDITLQGRDNDVYYTSYSLSQSFFKKKLDLSVTFTDPHRKYRTYYRITEDKDFYMKSTNRIKTRSFNVRLGYRFGKMDVQVKKASRSIENDDRFEGGGGKGGGGDN